MTESLSLFGNPSSFNDPGREANNLLESSRRKIADFIGSKVEEVMFTSSGSEANNLAIFGLARTYKKPAEIITTPIEHSSVLEPFKILKSQGWKITYLKIDREGLVDLKDLGKKLDPKVKLVSIIYANNEIGTIQPVVKISKIIKDFNNKLGIHGTKHVLFHVDACQATNFLDMNVNNLGVDLMTFNGSKVYGPKGVGVLYARRGVPLRPIIVGGDQERGMRAGTENLLAIVGLAEAISLIRRDSSKKMVSPRDYFIVQVRKALPGIRINGPSGNMRLANNINISIPGLSSENILLELDKYGIYASAGSACTSRSVEPSHVLKSIGVERKYLSGALRFSLGRNTTKEDLNYVLRLLPKVVKDLERRYNKNRSLPSP